MAGSRTVTMMSGAGLFILSALGQPHVGELRPLPDVPVQTFAFSHHETTGITSFLRVKGKEKAILFGPRSNRLALDALDALKVDIFLPNTSEWMDGENIYLRGYLDPVVKYTPSEPVFREPYQEFTLVDWYIVTPFIERQGYEFSPTEIRKVKRRRLRLDDFEYFDGKNRMNVDHFQQQASVRAGGH
jgi:hypothetical protein